jgi:hypothetical protein
MPRFQAGSRYAERLRVVVTIDENIVGTDVVTVAVSVRKNEPLHPEEGNVFGEMGCENPEATRLKPVLSEARPVP